MPKTKRASIVDQMMQERIAFGGMMFTRFGLLKELQERHYTAGFIDAAVFSPGIFCPIDLSAVENSVPNEVPESFWEDTAPNKLAEFYMGIEPLPAPDPMDELIAELISQRGPRNTEPGC